MFVSLPSKRSSYDVEVGTIDAQTRKSRLTSTLYPATCCSSATGGLALHGKPQPLGEAPSSAA